jgi:hypothetical protein
MTVQAPPILLEVQTSNVTPLSTWPADSTTWAGFPFSWTVTLNVTPQSTSFANSSVPYFYSGLDITEGMWVSNALDGAAWLIQSIISQQQNLLVCVLEDVNQYNTYADPTSSGDGSPPNSTSGFLFALNADNTPILTGVQLNVLTSQWQTDLLGRFSYLFPISSGGTSSGSFTNLSASGTTFVPTVNLSDNSNSIATTAWIQGQGYATLVSPTFTGTPLAVTPAPGTDTTQIATTEFVTDAFTAFLVSPIFSGSPQAPNPPDGDSSQYIATTEFVQDSLLESLQSPTFTGNPQAPTPLAGDNSEAIATTAFVAGLAPLIGPTFTGSPTAPTPSPGDNSTAIATTAYVEAAVAGAIPTNQLSIYTAAGVINITDNYALINATTTIAMTLAAGTVNLSQILIKNIGSASATVTAEIDGTSQTVTLNVTSPIKDFLQLVWIASVSSYIVT